ncbi:MAG: DUF255 domain-containing protein [Helicobacteraceae bacterium]|jgi:thioredoxin-related protein|nr:DUF255 domain-containing protein [Helicobacteraceae bacterium]
MKRILTAIIFICVSAANLSAVDWYDNYGAALEKAREENKKVLVVVMRQSCPWCRKLINETLPAEAIDAKIQAEFVPLMLDTENNPREVDRSRLRAESVPASYILNPSGEIVNAQMGYLQPMQYMRFLQ